MRDLKTIKGFFVLSFLIGFISQPVLSQVKAQSKNKDLKATQNRTSAHENTHTERDSSSKLNLAIVKPSKSNKSKHKIEDLKTGQDVVLAYKTGQRDFSGWNLQQANLKGANLKGANLRGAYLIEANLTKANLTGASLQEAFLFKANLQGANFKGANLQRADLWWANLTKANFTKANLKKTKFLSANLTGAKLKEAELKEAVFFGANLKEAYLHKTNLKKADLRATNLTGAILTKANLYKAKLKLAKLQGADLSEANLKGANLKVADLKKANLSLANLSGANLINANLKQANLSGAILNEIYFFLADFKKAKYNNQTKFKFTSKKFNPQKKGMVFIKSDKKSASQSKTQKPVKRSLAQITTFFIPKSMFLDEFPYPFKTQSIDIPDFVLNTIQNSDILFLGEFHAGSSILREKQLNEKSKNKPYRLNSLNQENIYFHLIDSFSKIHKTKKKCLWLEYHFNPSDEGGFKRLII